MVNHADQYQWSSYNAQMNGNEPVIPDIYPCYLALGDSIKLVGYTFILPRLLM